ncbi:ABC transporter related protein [Methanolacinia petrolearia DSM 11571]|uniref:Cobalamin import ATP-binding protein BtuD n=1 Tax=Methanolacinia petrolearia (strain DSM 11571 / OCM 486 / SEBR 4847) TaxID=679926 RepID=E1RG38_METP4|nr:ABC transporter ATP-binding protein [Methanolacinia petrolearia]ADN36273.1 ABC transporter related protein [Methanolacinia petrolearia DSM 11571]
MIDADDIRFSYGNHPVLSGVSFHVDEGELCGLFGPNGAGKTTLFRCCLGFLELQGGRISINGEPTTGKRIEDLAKIVSYVPQEHKPPFPYLVKEIVLMGRTPHMGGIFGLKRRDKEIAMDNLDILGIPDLSDRPYNQLSGGQRQMVLMARALAQDTPVLFLDEPTSSLDFQNQMKIWRLMREIAEDGKTIIACSHDPNHVSWFCDRVVVIGNGGVVANGAPSDVICEDVLSKIYGNSCSVSTVDNIRIVIPGDLLRKNETAKKLSRFG